MKRMKRITAENIMAWWPCDGYPIEKVTSLFGRRKSATVTEVLRAPIPAVDRLWVVLREELISPRQLRLFACACANRALSRERKSGREPDKRSIEAIAVARRYAMGKATTEELSAAGNAAWSAADAAGSAAGNAAWSAADAAGSAAGSAAWSAAGNAARSAAWNAAWSAAWIDAGNAEVEWQVRQLLKILGRKPAKKGGA